MGYRTTDPSTSLTVQNNALVKATPSIVTSNILSKPDTTAGSESGGIVFDGKNGTVYGDVTLQDNLTINEDETLTVPDGSKLDCNNNLTNNGTILVESGGNLTGEPDGNIVYAPTIITQPADKSVTEGETATFTVEATGTEPLSYQWQQSNNGSDWTNIEGAIDGTYTIATTTMNMNGTQYRCVVKNSIDEVTSDAATLTVTAIPTYTITVQTDGNGTASADKTTAAAGETITLTATPNSGYHFVRWEVSPDTVTIADNKFTMPESNVTVTAVFAPDPAPQRPSTGNTGTSSGPDTPADPVYDFWNGVRQRIRDARPGDTLQLSVPSGWKVPSSVLRALADQEDLTLRLRWQDGDSLTLTSQQMEGFDGQGYFSRKQLAQWVTEPAAPQKPAAQTAGQTTPAPEQTASAPETAPETEPAAQPQADAPSPEEPAAQDTPAPEDTPAQPESDSSHALLWTAGAVVLLAAAGTGLWFALGSRKQ